MKKLSLSTLALFVSSAIFAQINVNVGLSGTVNGMVMLDQGLNTQKEYIEVYDVDFAPAGAKLGIDFNNKFGMQLESIYAMYQKVYEIKETVSNTDLGELKFDMNYLQIPMLFKFMNGGNGRVRPNFMFGPQLNILTQGQEALSLLQGAEGQTISIPDIPNTEMFDQSSPDYNPSSGILPDGTYINPETGQFTIPDGSIGSAGFEADLLGKNIQQEIANFKNQELHVVGGFGMDIDVSPKLFLSLLIKADYAVTDMRNGELIDQLANNTFSAADFSSRRANVALGAQFTISYTFNGTRYFLNAIR